MSIHLEHKHVLFQAIVLYNTINTVALEKLLQVAPQSFINSLVADNLKFVLIHANNTPLEQDHEKFLNISLLWRMLSFVGEILNIVWVIIFTVDYVQ